MPYDVTDKLAQRLKQLRLERGWSLDDLAGKSGVSRATLSRLEKAEVSPTTEVLGKLCPAYGLTLTRLLASVENQFQPVIRHSDQSIWNDREQGYERRVVSPPSASLSAEIIEATLQPRSNISYDAPPVPGLKHYLVMLEGNLTITIEGQKHELGQGDCLRYQLFGSSQFVTGASPAKYLLFLNQDH
ncbi:XRE family transcriptional regulator [Kiloniella laminariae]|uniref:XRE family transcriptional regulator n=1 Tax=Kiloniella laminariae TaxID=454162 RepID=A0ABT4LH70_9PROT|nr:XRE family transcriptional regulator [Kiloniella laminariae]MCZ4280434.1 XRE family transcriptional regulator [Kiloniella laminariae]